MKFYTRRPDAGLLAELEAEIEQKMQLSHLHEPGQGWHYVPGVAEIRHNGRYWYPCVPTSAGAICAHVEDVCKEMGLDFEELYRRAYPEEEFMPVTDEDRAACARPAVFGDSQAVVDDLADVNYHALAAVFEDATGVFEIKFVGRGKQRGTATRLRRPHR